MSAQSSYLPSASNTPKPQLQLQPSPSPSVFSLITTQEWNYIIVPTGFVMLCIFLAILNQHIRLNKLEKQIKNLRTSQITSNPVRTSVLSSTV